MELSSDGLTEAEKSLEGSHLGYQIRARVSIPTVATPSRFTTSICRSGRSLAAQPSLEAIRLQKKSPSLSRPPQNRLTATNRR